MKLRVASFSALILLSLGLIVLVSPATPAWACSCAFSPREKDAWADQIVTGTVTEVSSAAIQLAVESVEKGAPAAGEVRLGVSPGRGAGCGYDFRAGQRYRVNSRDGRTGLCVGVRDLPPLPSPAAPAVAAAPGDSGPGDSPGGWWLAAGVTTAALLAGAVIARRRRTG